MKPPEGVSTYDATVFAMSLLNDRLADIADRQRTTNALLAILVLRADLRQYNLRPAERAALNALVEEIFGRAPSVPFAPSGIDE